MIVYEIDELVDALDDFRKARFDRDEDPDLDLGGPIDSAYWEAKEKLRLVFVSNIHNAFKGA